MRYAHFDIRRAAFTGGSAQGGASSYAQFGLYNNTNGAEIIIIRRFDLTFGGSAQTQVLLLQGNLALTSVPVYPCYATEALPVGLATVGTTATQPNTNGYNIRGNASWGFGWNNNFPFAAIPAGWSFVVQQNTADNAFFVGVLYEHILPEQLDELRWIEANAALLNAPNGR